MTLMRKIIHLIILIFASYTSFLQVSRLKRTWQCLESSSPDTMKRYSSELSPLADPGNGIYANILDRAIGQFWCNYHIIRFDALNSSSI